MSEESVFLAKVQKLYRLVIPKAIREALKIEEGDIVRVKIAKEEVRVHE